MSDSLSFENENFLLYAKCCAALCLNTLLKDPGLRWFLLHSAIQIEPIREKN